MVNTITKIDKDELLKSFFDELINVEFGDHFEKGNRSHNKLLNQRLDKHIANGAIIFGMFEEKRNDPIGFITIAKNQHLFHKDDSEILEIGVVEKYKRKGHGSQLIEYVERLFSQDDLNCIFVKTYAADHDVIYFYGKNGYVPISVVPDTNGPGDEGTIIMRKSL